MSSRTNHWCHISEWYIFFLSHLYHWKYDYLLYFVRNNLSISSYFSSLKQINIFYHLFNYWSNLKFKFFIVQVYYDFFMKFCNILKSVRTKNKVNNFLIYDITYALYILAAQNMQFINNCRKRLSRFLCMKNK